jgi:hypothetical protein
MEPNTNLNQYIQNENFVGSEKTAQQLGEQQVNESVRNQEILGNDYGMGSTIQKAGMEAAGFDLSQVNVLQSISGDVEVIIKLIVTNYSNQVNPQTRIKLNRIMRQKAFYISKNIDPKLIIDAGVGTDMDTKLGDLRDPVIIALCKVITGVNIMQSNDQVYSYQAAHYSQSILINYILNYTKLTNWTDAVRIYSSYKFHDPKIFKTFPMTKLTLQESYNRFLAIVRQASGGSL